MDSLSFAENVTPKLVNWFTPLWLGCVGVLVGLAILVLLWIVCASLSGVPVIGRLADNPVRRRNAMGILGTAFFVGLVALLFTTGREWLGAEPSFGTIVSWLVIMGLAAWLAGMATVVLVNRRTVSEVPEAVREGVLFPIFVITLCLAVVGVLGVVLVKQPTEMLASLARLPHTGLQAPLSFTIPGPEAEDANLIDPPEIPIDVAFRSREVRRLTFDSDQSLLINTRPVRDPGMRSQIEVFPGQSYRWVRAEQSDNPFPDERVAKLYVMNFGSGPAQLTIRAETQPAYPQVTCLPVVAVSVVALFLFYIVQRALMPKASAVALATVKSEVNQPLFLVLLAIGIILLIAFIWIPYHTFGEDVKVLKDNGLKLIMVLAMFSSVWAASTSIAEEVEGRTALTVLSKPIERRSFILGKFLGISWTTTLLFLALGLLFLAVTSYKPIYDSRESSADIPSWELSYREVTSVVPGLLLAFMSTMVLTAISVAISTRLPLLPNFLICFSIYVLGNLTPLIVQSGLGRFEIVRFVGQLIATLVPNLDTFNTEAAIAAGRVVPLSYLGWAAIYSGIYCLIAMLLSLLLFEDRDVA